MSKYKTHNVLVKDTVINDISGTTVRCMEIPLDFFSTSSEKPSYSICPFVLYENIDDVETKVDELFSRRPTANIKDVIVFICEETKEFGFFIPHKGF